MKLTKEQAEAIVNSDMDIREKAKALGDDRRFVAVMLGTCLCGCLRSSQECQRALERIQFEIDRDRARAIKGWETRRARKPK